MATHWLIATIVLFGTPAVAATSNILLDATQLLQRGEPEAAYRLLLAEELHYADNPRFNYLLGISALEIGEFSEALFALRRAVAQRPGDLGARMDLARAYYGIGDYASAEDEFRELEALAPPPETARVIANYLRAIKRRTAKQRQTWSASVGLEAGYDSNANSATDLRDFQGFRLREASRSAESDFAGLVGQLTFSHPITARTQAVFESHGLARQYGQASYLNRHQMAATAGVRYQASEIALSLQAGGSRGYLDNSLNERIAHIDFSARHLLAPGWYLKGDVRHSRLRYADLLDLRNVDSWLGSASSVWTDRGQLRFGVVVGKDRPRQARSPFGRTLLGGDTQALWVGQRGWQWIANGTVLVSRYDGLFTASSRRDQYIRLAIATNVLDFGSAGWVLRPELAYERNRSSITLYDYERIRAGIQIRRVFD